MILSRSYEATEEGEKKHEDERGTRRHGSVSLIWGSDYERPIYKRALSWFVTTIISDVQRL